MPKSARALLTDLYDAWRAHDLDLLAIYLPSDFSHSLNIPVEVLPVGGPRRGKGEAIERLKQIFKGFDTQYLEPGEIVTNGNRFILDVHTRCQERASGTWLDTKKKHVWLIEDGWPVELSEFYDLEQFEIFMNAVRR